MDKIIQTIGAVLFSVITFIPVLLVCNLAVILTLGIEFLKAVEHIWRE